MKLYQLSCMSLLALTALAGCGNGDAPVEVTVTEQEIPTLTNHSSIMTYVVITASADQVTVNRAKINRGNGCGTLSWYGSDNLKYGQSLKGSNLCRPDQIKEVTVETDQGDYTFNF